MPAGLKNFFLLFGQNELGQKPALMVTVSSGDGGAYLVAELRMSTYKIAVSVICPSTLSSMSRGVGAERAGERNQRGCRPRSPCTIPGHWI